MHTFQKIQEIFKRLIEQNALSHAYLFFGAGIESRKERRELARWMARSLEGKVESEKGKDYRPLAEYLEIVPDEKKTIGIDAVRVIAGFLSVLPAISKHRTVFIDHAESLTPEAQNAILKIVEEPPAHGLILASADNPESIFPTLRSRFQRIYIPANGSVEREKGKEKSKTLDEILAMKVIDDDTIDSFFTDLLARLDKDPVNNVKYLKSALRKLVVIKAFNTNVRLQLRALQQDSG